MSGRGDDGTQDRSAHTHPQRLNMITRARMVDHGHSYPPIFSIHRARVVSIREFGAFIAIIDDDRTTGLVHISELSSSRVDNVSDVVDIGEHVWVKLIDIKPSAQSDRPKLSFSMKHCDQGSGNDMDINNVKLSVDNSRKKSFRGEAAPISVGAILDTVCTRCGVHGHIQQECFSSLTNDTQYELLPEDDELDAPEFTNELPTHTKPISKESRHHYHKSKSGESRHQHHKSKSGAGRRHTSPSKHAADDAHRTSISKHDRGHKRKHEHRTHKYSKHPRNIS